MKRFYRILCVALILCLMTVFVSCGRAYDVPGYGDKYDGNTSLEGVDISKLPTGSKLIRTVTVSALTDHFDAFIAALNTKMGEIGAYASKENYGTGSSRYYDAYYYYDEDMRYADMTIRVPADKVEDLLSVIRGGSTVKSLASEVDDVTLTYSALDARAETLEAEIVTVTKLLDDCTTVTEVAAIEKQLTELQSELAEIRAKLDVYDHLVAYSTVNLYLREVPVPPEEVKEPGAFRRMLDGFVESVSDIGSGFVDFVVWFVSAIPYFILLGAIGTGGFFLVRAIVRGGKRRGEKRKGDNSENK